MSPVWVAFLLGAIVWVPMGTMLSALCFAAARGDIEREAKDREDRAESRGFARGKRAGSDAMWCAMEGDLRRKVAQDIIRDDTATTGADREVL